VRSSKRWQRSGEIPDRLLTTGSDRGQLANTANRQMTAFAQQQASDAPAPDYRFARPDVAELTIELATEHKPATGRC